MCGRVRVTSSTGLVRRFLPLTWTDANHFTAMWSLATCFLSLGKHELKGLHGTDLLLSDGLAWSKLAEPNWHPEGP